MNSINWARILAQIVYYFSSYFSLLSQLTSEHPDTTSIPNIRIQYAVPTGNFGDILAGFYAKRLGIPVEPLLIATNENDILTRFFRTGRYEKADSSSSSANDINNKENAQTEKVHGTSDGAQSSAAVKSTLSPAMDILVSSNFERLLWYLAFENMCSGAVVDEQRGDVDGGVRVRIDLAGKIVREWMAKLKSEGSFAVPTHVLKAAQREFVAERVSDEEVRPCLLTDSDLLDADRVITDGPVSICRPSILFAAITDPTTLTEHTLPTPTQQSDSVLHLIISAHTPSRPMEDLLLLLSPRSSSPQPIQQSSAQR